MSGVLCYAPVAHLCCMFYVACSVSRARRASVLQILRRALVAFLHHVLCVARSSHVLCYTPVAHLFDMFCVACSSRWYHNATRCFRYISRSIITLTYLFHMMYLPLFVPQSPTCFNLSFTCVILGSCSNLCSRTSLTWLSLIHI